MARPAPGIDRAFRVLRYLAAHPDQSFTLSELSRTLDMNKATCHSMFATMVEHGVITRNPSTKSYSLGPTLITLASSVAPEKARAVDCARGEMERLTEDLGLATIITGLLNNESAILARRLPKDYQSPTGNPLEVGSRRNWAAPIGSAFAAWAPPKVVERWINSALDPASPAKHGYFERRLAVIRQRGYDLGLAADPRTRLLRVSMLLEAQATSAARDMIKGLINELDDVPYDESDNAWDLGSDEQHLVFHITAPIFGSDGDVAVTLTLDGFSSPLDNTAILSIADTLLDSTEHITRVIGGRFPSDWPRELPEPRSRRGAPQSD